MGPLTNGATSPGCHSGVPLVPMVFRALLMERCATQGEYVILDMKNKKDHINLLLHFQKHTFSYTYATNNVAEDAKHFDLDALFSKYALSPYWTARKLTALALNISKYNSVVTEANKKKKSPRKPSTSGAGGSRSAPRPVPSMSRATEGPSRHSTPSKRTREEMEKSGVTETAEVSSPPVMPTPLKKGENPDAVKDPSGFQQLLEGLLAHGTPLHIQRGLLQVREVPQQVGCEVARERGCEVADKQSHEQRQVG